MESGALPVGTMQVLPYPGIGDRPEVVERRARFTGERLIRANATTDPQTGQWVLSFGLDGQGTSTVLPHYARESWTSALPFSSTIRF